MAANCSLITVMDRLWFFEIIFLPESISTICSKCIVSSPMADVVETASTLPYRSQDDNDPKDSLFPAGLISQDDCNNGSIETKKNLENIKDRKRPTRLRLDLISNRRRSQSSSPSIHKPSKSLTFLDDMDERLILQRTLNCMPSLALELEELQGFLDLGFRFEKDQITPRTMSMIPGLQRLEGHGSNFTKDYATTMLDGECQGENCEEEKKEVMMRPYLSEAWFVKRPNSPLLRLRMARVTSSEEMKKCLKVWARTVASTIHSNEKK